VKAIPCRTEGCNGGAGTASAKARAALGFTPLSLKGGGVYLIQRAMSFPLVAKCAACRRPSSFTAAQFNALPDLSVAQLRALGALPALTKDWQGDGLTHDQAVDMVALGMMGPGDPSVPPPQERP
jgi:hypothetical protein